MQMNPYLTFNGQCEAAFRFYETCLGAKITCMMRYGETPAAEHSPPDMNDKIIHTQLLVGDDVLMGSDAPKDRYEPAKGFSVTVSFDEPAEAERVFHALAEDGSVSMPIGETFWAIRFGMLVDKFGIPWMVNCGKKPAAAV